MEASGKIHASEGGEGETVSNHEKRNSSYNTGVNAGTKESMKYIYPKQNSVSEYSNMATYDETKRKSQDSNTVMPRIGFDDSRFSTQDTNRQADGFNKTCFSSIKQLFEDVKLSKVRTYHSLQDDNEQSEDQLVDMSLYPGWERLCEIKANELFPLTKYVSKTTGLTLVHSSLNSTTIHCYFFIRTKPYNDDGIPHMLEYLLHQGSVDYPYDMALDLISSKCLSSGTDSWTYSDHTCFKLMMAGLDQFVTMLPIYFDHIFFPLLEESVFYTEIHHINGEGVDSGVMFSERLQVEHTPQDVAHQTMIKKLYPTESGYHYNCAGTLDNIRKVKSIKPAKNFHAQYYHPKNVCIFCVGDINTEQLFKVMDPIILKLEEKSISPENWVNPWYLEIPLEPLPNTIVEQCYFPSEEENYGLVKIAILGGKVEDATDIFKKIAMKLMMEYLCLSAASPIKAAFTEQEIQIATSVKHSEMSHLQSVYCLQFESVPVSDMDEIEPMLRYVLEKEEERFNIEKMKSIIRHVYHEEMSAIENSWQEKLAGAVLNTFLYNSEDPADSTILERMVNLAFSVEHFEGHTAGYWKKLIRKRLLDVNWLVVKCIPSSQLHEDLIQQELARKNGYSRKALKRFERKLRAAIRLNESRSLPAEFLNSLPNLQLNNHELPRIGRYNNPDWASNVLCNLYVDDVNTNYIYLTVLMDTSELDFNQKKYLTLFAASLFESPFDDDRGNKYTKENLMTGISLDVLSHETTFGISAPGAVIPFEASSYAHILSIRFQIELTKVYEGFQWMRIILWKTRWTGEDLKILATKLAHSVDYMKDYGQIMVKAVLKDSLYKMDSVLKTNSLIRQQKLLKKVASELPAATKRLTRIMNSIRHVVLRPENTTVHVATSLPRLEKYLVQQDMPDDGLKAIGSLIASTFDYTGWDWNHDTKRLPNDPDTTYMKNPSCFRSCPQETILRLASREDESSCLIQAAPCITDYNDPLYAQILTASQYFCQPGGPFHKAIKGKGFGSKFSMTLSPNEGVIYFSLGPCANLVGGYIAAFSVIAAHLGEIKSSAPTWDENVLDGAKRSIIFGLFEKENKPNYLMHSSLLDYFSGVPDNFNRLTMERVSKVTMEQVISCTRMYLRDLFLENVPCAVAAPTSSVPDIIHSLVTECGKRLTLMPSVQQSSMAYFDT